MQTSLEFCRKQRKQELSKFVNVLKALPQGRLDYRPDPKARTAGELAWLLAAEEAALVSLLDTGVVEWKEKPAPSRAEEIVAAFEKNAAAVNDRLERLDAAGWDKKGRFLMGSAPAWEDSVGEFVWGFLFDEIHHRGQLSTYLRPMGGKVPSIYGPSADDPGQ
ncbi:MAG TPA: DinB family protein [Vicinamibacteria bacterium]|nr:DinB family protein [Vicinamibacteria bacterium]